ncbi:MAG: hypothetical protein ABW128_07695 [Rhizorhabdus sp.]
MKVATCLLLSAAPLALGATPAQAAAPAAQQATPTETATPQDGEAEAPAAGDDIIVVGLRASLQSAQRIKQRSDSIVDALVAQDIGKLPRQSGGGGAGAVARRAGHPLRRRGDGRAGPWPARRHLDL